MKDFHYLRGGMLLAAVTFAQCLYGQVVEGHFRIEKQNYLVGEPIFVEFEIMNVGVRPIEVMHESPYCSGYGFLAPRPAHNWFACQMSIAGSCLGGIRPLASGEKWSERLVLQYWLQLGNPGTYRVQAHKQIRFRWADTGSSEGLEPPVDTEGDLVLTIEAPASPDQLKSVFQPYLRNLASKNQEAKDEAAHVITEVAPGFLEETILEMANEPEMQYYALIGLRNLNTLKSRARLAEWARGWRILYSSYQERAIEYLGGMGDRSYLPLLLELAGRSDSSYLQGMAMRAAGELGGEEAVPRLLDFLKSRDVSVRANALWALARTKSREAVPALIELIRDRELAQAALGGLQVLSHKRLGAAGDPKLAYQKWLEWWKVNGQSAVIYGPCEPSEPEILN